MQSYQKTPVSACAGSARTVVACLAVTLLFAAVANADTMSVSSYNSWQWNGFSRTSFSNAASSFSSFSSSSWSSWSSDPAVSVSSLESSAVASGVGSASLSGVVYYDVNQDGIRDSNDWGIRDAVVSLTSASDGTVLTAMTDKDGAYSFNNLVADNYTITLLTPSTQPGQPSVGSMNDASGNAVSTGLGAVSGQTSISDVELSDGATGINYDFAQLVYPTDLISKRMLLNADPGVYHTKPGPALPPPVPEPGSVALLIVAGLSLAGFTRRRSSVDPFAGD